MPCPSSRGFRLIEIAVALAVMAALSAAAMPKVRNFSGDSREAACRAALGSIRAAITRHSQSPGADGPRGLPSLAELTRGDGLGGAEIPPNPYSTSAAARQVVGGLVPGRPVTPGTAGGWCYDEVTGSFWPDTDSGAGEAGF